MDCIFRNITKYIPKYRGSAVFPCDFTGNILTNCPKKNQIGENLFKEVTKGQRRNELNPDLLKLSFYLTVF